MPSLEQKFLAALCFAMGHPRRVAIFDLLYKRPEVGETLTALETASRLARGTLIHHLRQMEKNGLVQRRAKGSATQYSLDPTALGPAAKGMTARAKPIRAVSSQTRISRTS